MTGNPITADIGQGELYKEAQDGLIQHIAIFLADGGILSDETFRLVKFSGQESISQPFHFQLELRARTEPKVPLNFSFKDILTRPVTVGIDLPGCSPRAFAQAIRGGDVQHLSLWNGIATDLTLAAPGIYHLTLQPALHRLGLTNRYHLHRQLNIRGAIEAVLADHSIRAASGSAVGRGATVSTGAITGSDNPAVARVQDWLQAGESDLDLINRLMQKAHIYYFFEHGATGHRIVFANKPAYPRALPAGKTLRYVYTNTDHQGMEQDDLILDYNYAQSMSSTGVSNVLARQEPAWEQDTVARYDTYKANSSEQIGDLPFRRFQICQYGGSDGEVKWDAATCDATRTTATTSLSGASHCARMRAGHTFQLDGSGIPEITPYPIRPTLAWQEFVLNSVSHDADLGGSYRNQFQATEAGGQVAPFGLQDTQQGAVLARVVKHDNGAYPKDWRYYRRNAFDPETDKLKDVNAAGDVWKKPKGVYVQFATDPADADPVWVKLAQHMLTVPELGVTVMVGRAGDHSELPEIQSIVQNNGHMTVTPSRWTASTSVGCSYGTSYGDNRSISYGFQSSTTSPQDLASVKAWVDDKYNQCQPNVSGWFSDTHFKGVSWSKGNSSSYSIAENGRTDVLSESKSIGSTYSEFDAKWTKSISVVDDSWSKSTSINTYGKSTVSDTAKSISDIGTSDSHSTIDKSISWSKVNRSESTSHTGISIGTATTGISTYSSAVGISNANSAVGVTNNNSATGVAVNLSATGISTYVSATGISAGASATGLSTNASLTGTSTNTALTGVNSNTSATGVSNNTSATGASSNINAVGASSDISAVGASTSISAIGSSTSISASGSSTQISATGSSTQISVVGNESLVSVRGSATVANIGPTAVEVELTGTEMKLISALMVMI